MRVTKVKIRLIDKENTKLKGFADVTFDDCFVVHGIAIIDGSNGLFVGMPYREETNGNGDGNVKPEKIDICHPVTRECRDMLDEAIFDAYEEEMDR